MSIAKYSDCSLRRNKLRNFPTNLLPVAAAAPRTGPRYSAEVPNVSKESSLQHGEWVGSGL